MGPVIGSLCTGALGLDLGVLAAFGTGRVAWCADRDPHVRAILAERLPDTPNLGDLRDVDFSQVHPVDVVTVGFPCQDISAAGRRAGIEKGTRSGLWTHVVAAVRLLRPALVVVENVAALRWRNGGLHRVLGDLAQAGYDALWRSVRASDVGAPHRRERVFLLAWPQTDKSETDENDTASRRPTTGHRVASRSTAFGFRLENEHLLPTPTEHDGSSNGLSASSRRRGPSLLDELHHVARGRNAHVDPVSLLPTPTAVNPNDGADLEQWLARRERHRDRGIDGNGMGTPLSIAIRLLATPTASDANNGTHRTHSGGPSLSDQVQLLPTPRVSDTGTAGRRAGPSFRPPLSQQVLPLTASDALLPTPKATDGTKGSPAQRGSKGDLTLPSAAVRVCTPVPSEQASTTMNWGPYAAAIHRWEQVCGRLTPYPTHTGRHGRPVLAPSFVEHLMGLPDGWVTAVGIPRTAQLRALGNGVVPHQAAHAVRLLLTDLQELTISSTGDDVRSAA